MVEAENTTEIRWRLAERSFSPKSLGWRYGVVFLTFLLCGLAFWLENFLFAVVIVLFGGVIILQSNQIPKEKNYVVNHDGVGVDDDFFPYPELISFILFERDGFDFLLLKKNQKFRQFLEIPLPKEPLAGEILEKISWFLKREAI